MVLRIANALTLLRYRSAARRTFSFRCPNASSPIFPLFRHPFAKTCRSAWPTSRSSVYPSRRERNVTGLENSGHALDFEAIKTFMLRASAGVVKQKHDSKYELSSFQVCVLSSSHP